MQLLCAHCNVSRWPDVHGAEEALLSAHLATGLDRPPLEAVLRCTEASQSNKERCDHREPLQRRVQLAEDDGHGHCIWEGTRPELCPLI